MEKGTDWVVRLGREEWMRFTYERPAGHALQLLGSVTRGPQTGALARDQDGNYVQVNGDYTSPLNSPGLRQAAAAARSSSWKPFAPIRQEAARVPVVTVKRRRVVSPAGTASTNPFPRECAGS
jgi:hypothetical protein